MTDEPVETIRADLARSARARTPARAGQLPVSDDEIDDLYGQWRAHLDRVAAGEDEEGEMQRIGEATERLVGRIVAPGDGPALRLPWGGPSL